MKRNLNFIWIDDLPSRELVANNLEDALNISINFKNVKGQDLEESIKQLVKDGEPQLIIIDHKLEDSSDGSFKTGSTAASIIRESWPDCPIVCVSGVQIEEFNLTQKDIYDAIFPESDISLFYNTIDSLAISYLEFKRNHPKNIDEFIKMLGDTGEEADRLKSIIPSKIKDNLADRGVIRHISTWIRSVLFERPGFLFDSLWAATFLGLKESGFDKVKDIFEKGKYSGLFVDDSKPRWWKSQLLSILSDGVESLGLPWEKGRELPNLNEDDFSICYVTGESYPETVAFTDDTHKERQPMKLKETVADESFQDLLYFEELRKMSPAE